MRKKITLDANSLKIVLQKYKEYLIPAAVIGVCLLLFFSILVPQFQGYLHNKAQEGEYQERITKLKGNIALLQGLDKNTLDSQFAVSSHAVPFEKDYAGVLDALSNTAQSTGVGLGDYSFSVGELAPKSVSKQKPSVPVEITVNGQVRSVVQFIQRLSESLPLSETTSVQAVGKFATITLEFYYKPNRSGKFDGSIPLGVLAPSEKKFLDTLFEWQKNSQVLTPVASASAL